MVEIWTLTNDQQNNIMTTELQSNIAEEINGLHAQASAEADHSRAHADTAIESAWKCGVKLNEQKEALDHGDWLTWMQANCPNIHIRTAQRYMGLADKYDTLSHLKEAQRVKALLIAAGVMDEPEQSSTRPSEGGVSKPDEGAVWVTKAAVYFNTHDLTTLDVDSRQVWIGRLKPLVEVYERLRAV